MMPGCQAELVASLSKIGNAAGWRSWESEEINNFMLDILSLEASRKSRQKYRVRSYKCVSHSQREEIHLD